MLKLFNVHVVSVPASQELTRTMLLTSKPGGKPYNEMLL